jgi:hypothetical protein
MSHDNWVRSAKLMFVGRANQPVSPRSLWVIPLFAVSVNRVFHAKMAALTRIFWPLSAINRLFPPRKQ